MEVKKNNLVSIDRISSYDHVHSQIMVKFDNRSVEDVSEVQCHVYTNNEDPKDNLVVAKHKDNYYKGVMDHNLDSLCRNYLVIRKNKTNSVALVPYTVCHARSISEKKAIYSDMNDPTTRELSFKALCNNFGSKKLKRYSNIKSRMSIDKATVQDNITDAIDGVQTKVEELKADLKEDSAQVMENLVPARDHSASDPSRVYNVDRVITSSERECLHAQANAILSKEIPLEKLSGFLKSYITVLGDDLKLEKLDILLYVDCLFNYLSLNPAQLKTKSINNSICPYSDAIASKIVREFSVQRCRPLYMKNKTVCYAFVALLLINNYKVHMETVAAFLKGITPKQALMLLRVVGLTPLSRSDKSIYVLRTPLPPLPTNEKKRSR